MPKQQPHFRSKLTRAFLGAKSNYPYSRTIRDRENIPITNCLWKRDLYKITPPNVALNHKHAHHLLHTTRRCWNAGLMTAPSREKTYVCADYPDRVHHRSLKLKICPLPRPPFFFRAVTTSFRLPLERRLHQLLRTTSKTSTDHVRPMLR